MKKELKLKKFKDEDEERDFWANVKLNDSFSPDDFDKVSFPNLKPTSKSVSIILPENMLNRVKEKASSMNISYQSLIKSYIQKGVELWRPLI